MAREAACAKGEPQGDSRRPGLWSQPCLTQNRFIQAANPLETGSWEE